MPAAPRSFTVLPGRPTVSTRFNTVHPGRAPLPGPPRFTTVVFEVFDMSKTTGKTPGSSRSIRHHPGPSRWHYGSTPGTPRFTPVLPGSPRSMDRGEPGSTGAQWDWGINHVKIDLFQINHNPESVYINQTSWFRFSFNKHSQFFFFSTFDIFIKTCTRRTVRFSDRYIC